MQVTAPHESARRDFIVLIAVVAKSGGGGRYTRQRPRLGVKHVEVNRSTPHLPAGRYNTRLVLACAPCVCASGDASVHPFGLLVVRETGGVLAISTTAGNHGASYKFSKKSGGLYLRPLSDQSCVSRKGSWLARI